MVGLSTWIQHSMVSLGSQSEMTANWFQVSIHTAKHYVDKELHQVDDIWFIGCGLVVLASLFSSLSVNLQKHAHLLSTWHDPRTRTKERIKKLEGPVWQRPQWLLGISLLITGSIFDFVALAFCSQITVGVLGALSMVINLWVTNIYLHEPVGRLECVSTCVIICGCVICVVASSQQTKVVYSVDQIILLYRNAKSLFFLSVTTFLIIVLRVTVALTDRVRYPLVHRFCHPASAGLVGSMGVLFGKYAAEIIHSVATHPESDVTFLHAMNLIETILTITLLFVTIFFQLRWLNEGLHYFDALFTVPTFQVNWVIGSVCGGAVVFKEMERMNAFRSVVFVFGVFMAISGVIVMAQRRLPESSKKSFVPDKLTRSKDFVGTNKSKVPKVPTEIPV